VGTLDDPGSRTPDAVNFTDDAMSWTALPAFTQTYDFRELLQPDKIARLKDLAHRAKAAG